MESFSLRRPDDWHLHLRDGAMLQAALPYSAMQVGRAIIMPNLTPPITTIDLAVAYRKRIENAIPKGQNKRSDFTPLMTAYLTDTIDPDMLEEGFTSGVFTAAKLYPANATTNSENGVSDIRKIDHVIARMEKIGMPLLMHGEVVSDKIDIFDREAVFIDMILKPLMARHPNLKMVLEHITTAQAAAFVSGNDERLGATITPHHLIINRSDMFKGGIRPHLFCLPIAKRETHRQALRKAATSGHPRIFYGTDSAPHPIHAKESACGCAGIFNAATATALYLEVFEEENALEHFEAFAAFNGADFYGLPRNNDTLTLKREAMPIPHSFVSRDGEEVIFFRGGEKSRWQLS